MVNERTTTSRPGLAYWLLVLLVLPLMGVLGATFLQLMREHGPVPALVLAVFGVLLAAVSALLVAWLPRLRRMPARARRAWTLGASGLGVGLTAGWLAAIYVAFMAIACSLGGNCL